MDAMAAYPPPQAPVPTNQPNHPYYTFPPAHPHPPPAQNFPPPYYAPPPVQYPQQQCHHHQNYYHSQQQQQQQQQEAYQDEVRTLFIAGLPDDVKYREVYNLFREFPGYRSCQLKHSERATQVYAFTVFTDQQSALAAMHALNGMDFDPETGAVLHIDLAKANSRSKRSRTDDGGSSSSDKRIRGPNSVPGVYPDAGVGGTVHMPGMANSGYSDTSGFPSTQSGGMMGAAVVQDGVPGLTTGQSAASAEPAKNPPCPTLFVANLGPTCSEEELTQVFSRCPGFLKLKMQIRGGLPVAFVDFQDITSSTQALYHLQNTMLHSSDRGGMRLEYAKARMGLPKRGRKP